MNKFSPEPSPKNRFLSGLFGGRRGPRFSVGNPTSIVCNELMEKVGVHFPEAHMKAELMAELSASGYSILGFDTIMPVFSVQQEAEALGCVVDWGNDDMMPDARTHPFQDPDKLVVPRSILEKPSMKVVLEAISLLRKEYGSSVTILGKVMGPWTLSYHLAGVQDFLSWTLLDPDRVMRFLHVLKEVTAVFGAAQMKAGADVITIADHATGDLVGPKMYRDFLLPIHQEILERIGAPTVLHVCGNCLDRLEYFIEAGFTAYHFESKTDAKKAVQIVKRRISLIGNVNNSEILYRGTPEDVYEQIKDIIDSGADVVAPECAVPLGTPLRNLRAIVESVEDICGTFKQGKCF